MKPIGLRVLWREEKERRDKKTKERGEERSGWRGWGMEENRRGEERKWKASEIAEGK